MQIHTSGKRTYQQWLLGGGEKGRFESEIHESEFKKAYKKPATIIGCKCKRTLKQLE